jgi:iron-sulfur cluster assembly protein
MTNSQRRAAHQSSVIGRSSFLHFIHPTTLDTPKTLLYRHTTMITVTDSAFQHLQALVLERGEPEKGLRILVESGGCAGMQYGMTLDAPQAGDEIFEKDAVKVLVDPQSLQYLKGSTVDYSDDLAGAGFRIHNPNAVRSCGCGTSFEAGAAETAAEHAQH